MTASCQSIEPVCLDGTILDGLLRQYYEELHALAQSHLRNRERAADVVQDAVVRVLSAGAEGGLPVANPRHFLRRVVANLARDMLRQDRRRGLHVPLDGMVEIVADPAPDAERTLCARQEYRILCGTLGRLPPRCREALLLNRVERLSHAAIARRLGVSPTAVAKYIGSALKHCLAALADAP